MKRKNLNISGRNNRGSTKLSACIQRVTWQQPQTNCSLGSLTPFCSKKSISAAKTAVIIYRPGRGRGLRLSSGIRHRNQWTAKASELGKITIAESLNKVLFFKVWRKVILTNDCFCTFQSQLRFESNFTIEMNCILITGWNTVTKMLFCRNKLG